MHLFPHRSRKRAGEVLSAIAITLRRWLVSQLIAMLVIGVVTTVVLLLLGVRAAVALGIIAGVLEFVPYVGPILSAVPAIAMGLLDGPEKALWVVVAYTLIQLAENHVLIPLIMQEGIDIPPVLTLLVQASFAIVLGFLGLLVAVPLLGALMVPIKMLYVEDVVGDEVTRARRVGGVDATRPAGLGSGRSPRHARRRRDPARRGDAAAPGLRRSQQLPFSNRQEEGFENRIAALVTSDLGRPLRYVWLPERRVTCAAPSERVSATCCSACRRTSRPVLPTRPYYRSTYVFLSRRDDARIVRSLDDSCSVGSVSAST
jgi:hypothetical protein